MSQPESARRAARSERSASAVTPDRVNRWAALAHLGGILGVIPALVIYLSVGTREKRTRIESKEALNWQITFLIGLVVVDALAVIVGGLVVLVGGWAGHPGTYPAALVLGAVSAVIWLPNIVLSVLGFVRVSAGGSYRYPFAVRLIK